MNAAALTNDAVWQALRGVPDPEVPVLSVVDLGIVRDVRTNGDEIEVDITPTYSGCPAMQVIEHDIIAALEAAGAAKVRVRTVYQPAWSTEWISADARERLRAYGIAPPGHLRPNEEELVTLRRRRETVACPRCGSRDTELKSEFGATACKAMWVCRSCREPFEEFKAF